MWIRAFRAAMPLMASAALVLDACGTTEPTVTPRPSGATTFQPTYAAIACPEDVEIALLVRHACGRLRVLEDRSTPAGRTITVFVVRMDPPGGGGSSDPMLGIGGDIGDAAGFGGLAPLPGRVHRTLYLMEPRGVDHSQPSLACPEFDALAIDAGEASSGSPIFRQKVLTAVKACRDRLTASGVDVAAYDAAAAAADVADLRRALGIMRWNLIGFGSQSRILIEAARQDPHGVRSVVLDSPQLPDLPDALLAERGLHQAFEMLASTCANDTTCNATAPGLSDLLKTALAELDTHPVTVTNTTGALARLAGVPVRIRVDGGTLLRVVRSILGGDGPANLADLPATIASAAVGGVSEQLVRIVGSDPTLCAGYRPTCPYTGSFSLGAYLSILCRDDAPFIDLAAVDGDPTPAYHTVFGDNPYLAACVPWAVPRAADAVHHPLGGTLPVLVLAGQFDAFVPDKLITQSLSNRPATYLVRVPAQTHNVLGFTECTVAIRNAWVDHPEAPPADTSCLATLKVLFAAPPS
jgi:pimeloyl-ACP methyl ester carboxylesterase